jgi:hypothetical protein
VDGSGGLLWFVRSKWTYAKSGSDGVLYGIKGPLASLGNTETGAGLPPNCHNISSGYVYIIESTNSRGAIFRIYHGSSGNTLFGGSGGVKGDTAMTNREYRIPFSYTITATSFIRNHVCYIDSSSVEQAITGTADIRVFSYEE